MKNGTKGLIIINLGSPDSPSVPDVKRYLKEFLMDEKVIDINPFSRNILVKGIIAPFRSPKSSEAYQSIWQEHGSPLKYITKKFTDLLQKEIKIPVVHCMRYGSPSPTDALKELENMIPELDEILIAPMYPHYAMSSYETALEHVKKSISSLKKNIKIRVLKPFYNEPGYISALVNTIQPYLDNNNFDGYLFSYHGLPVRHLKKADPTKNHCYAQNDCCKIKSEEAWKYCYKHQVTVTTKMVTDKLKLQENKVFQSFQSRIGKGWIEPYTDKMFEELPKKGIKKLLVLCPAFVVDCLETLEEIHIRGKELFLKNGGEEFIVVPCLNTSQQWVEAFSSYCNEYEGKHSNLWN